MIENQRYLIAKYAPDIRRMEPVNIGIVAWARGHTSAMFLPIDDAAPIVKDRAIYQRWIGHWSKLMGASTIESKSGQIPKSSPLFVDEFLKSQKGNYILSDGGEIVDRITAKNIHKATSFLFEELVARKGDNQPTTREQAVKLQFLSASLLKEAGVASHDEFKKSFPVVCRIGQIDTEVKVHYAIGNGKPRSVFQRVQIAAVQSVQSAYFMFEHLRTDAKLGKENCASLVYSDNDADSSSDMLTALKVLAELSTVVNCRNKAQATSSLKAVAAAAGNH